MSTELHTLMGAMLDHVADQLRARAEEWIEAGRDIADLALLIAAENDGMGRIASLSRRELASELLAEGGSLRPGSIGEQVTQGPTFRIPAIFYFVDERQIHVMWIEPVHSSEVH